MAVNPEQKLLDVQIDQAPQSLIDNITDFNSFTDYLSAVAFVTFAIIYIYLIFRVGTSRVLRDRFLGAVVEANSSIATFTSIFFGVRTRVNNQDRGMDRKIDEIKEIIESKSYTISEESESKIVEYFDSALKRDFSEQLQQSLANFTKLELTKFINNDATGHLQRARYRLDLASSSVSVRGVVSLILGIILAIGALLILRDMVSSLTEEDIDSSTVKSILFYSLTRVSLAVFITFISYFFLSLYRRSLDEVKFYQNELTNMDLWSSSLSFAMQVEDPKVRAYFVARMLDIDRNQSTSITQGSAQGKTETVKISDEILKSIIDKIPS